MCCPLQPYSSSTQCYKTQGRNNCIMRNWPSGTSHPPGYLITQQRYHNMDETKSKTLHRTAEHNEIAGRTLLRCTSTFGQIMLATLLVCTCIPIVTGQRSQHPRLWPPANIEPCLVQCPAPHVQMTGNRSSRTEMVHWGPQPILDFMSNSQWQTSAPPLQLTPLAVDVAAASGVTTLVTSVTAASSSTSSRKTGSVGFSTSMAASGAEKLPSCNLVFQIVITLSCVALFHRM